MKKFETILFSTVKIEGEFLPQTVVGPHKIATEIRNLGISCQIIHHFHLFSIKELDAVLDKIAGDTTILIGFSTVFWSHFDEVSINEIAGKVQHIVNYFSTKYPNCKITAGGGSAAILPKRFNLKKLDALFEGYPEESFIEYVQSLKNKTIIPDPDSMIKNQNNTVTNVYKQREDNNIKFHNSKITYVPEDYIIPNDTAVIEVARGCIFKCKFCAFPLNGKKNFDYIKNIECLRDELIDNYEKYQFQNYIISDDTFNDSMHKMELLHSMITKLPFKIRLCTYLRLDLLNAHREQIDMLKEMGLAGTFFGVETFYKKSAGLVGKGLDPDKSKQLIHELKHTYWKDDVKVAVGLITGIPYETYQSYEETKKWILSVDNLVEQVRVAPLFIPNPKYQKSDPNISLFQKEYHKYGFYWVDKSVNWKNFNGPVKSYQEATEIATDLNTAVIASSRQSQGGFNLFQAWRSAQILDPSVSFEDLLKMNRFEFSAWLVKTYTSSNRKKYYDRYKRNFLPLLPK